MLLVVELRAILKYLDQLPVSKSLLPMEKSQEWETVCIPGCVVLEEWRRRILESCRWLFEQRHEFLIVPLIQYTSPVFISKQMWRKS